MRVENDVKAAALGADALRAGDPDGGSGSMAFLNVGTGIAAGIVTGGELWRGARGTAGEVGHISIDPERARSAAAGSAAASRRSPAARPSPSGGDAPVPSRCATSSMPRMPATPTRVALRAGLAHGIAAGVRVLVLTADVDAVVLGGGLTALGERLASDVRRELRDGAAASPFMRSLRLEERFELLPAGSPAAAFGAALVGAARDPEGVLAHG